MAAAGLIVETDMEPNDPEGCAWLAWLRKNGGGICRVTCALVCMPCRGSCESGAGLEAHRRNARQKHAASDGSLCSQPAVSLPFTASRTWDALVVRARAAMRRGGGDVDGAQLVYKKAGTEDPVPELGWARVEAFFLCGCGRAYVHRASRNRHAAGCAQSVPGTAAAPALQRRMATGIGNALPRVYKLSSDAHEAQDLTTPGMLYVRDCIRARADAGLASPGTDAEETLTCVSVEMAQRSAQRLILTPESLLPASLRGVGLDVTYRDMQTVSGVSPVMALRLCARVPTGDVEELVRAGVGALMQRAQMARDEMRAWERRAVDVCHWRSVRGGEQQYARLAPVQPVTMKRYQSDFAQLVAFVLRIVEEGAAGVANGGCPEHRAAKSLLREWHQEWPGVVKAGTAVLNAAAAQKATAIDLVDLLSDLAHRLLVEPFECTTRASPVRQFFAAAFVESSAVSDGNAEGPVLLHYHFRTCGSKMAHQAAALRYVTVLLCMRTLLAEVDKAQRTAMSKKLADSNWIQATDTRTNCGEFLALATRVGRQHTSLPQNVAYNFVPCDLHAGGGCGAVGFLACMSGPQLGDGMWGALDVAYALLRQLFTVELPDGGRECTLTRAFVMEVGSVPRAGGVDAWDKHIPGRWAANETSEQQDITRRAMEAASIVARFRISGANGKDALTPAALKKNTHALLKIVGKFSEVLMGLVNVGSPGPLRATELAHLRVATEPTGGVPRDIYLYRGTVTVLPQYSKTCEKQGVRLYGRCLPDPVGQLLFVHARLVMPVREECQRALAGTEALHARTPSVRLFEMPPQRAWRALDAGLDIVGVEMRPGQFRRWTVGMIRYQVLTAEGMEERSAEGRKVAASLKAVLGLVESEEGDDRAAQEDNAGVQGLPRREIAGSDTCPLDRALMENAGHSTHTASLHYTRTLMWAQHGEGAQAVLTTDMSAFFAAAQVWWRMLKIEGKTFTLRWQDSDHEQPAELGQNDPVRSVRNGGSHAKRRRVEGEEASKWAVGAATDLTAEESAAAIEPMLDAAPDRTPKVGFEDATDLRLSPLPPVEDVPADHVAALIGAMGHVSAAVEHAEPIDTTLTDAFLLEEPLALPGADDAVDRDGVEWIDKDGDDEDAMLQACVAAEADQDTALLRALGKACGLTGTGCWRSQTQELATKFLNRDTPGDALVVLATGGGKTAVMLAPVFAEREHRKELHQPHRRVTVLVTMFAAQAVDFSRRAKASGLVVRSLIEAHASGELRLAEAADVLTVAMENLRHRAYFEVMSKLVREGACARIVIDEAHEPWLSNSYRDEAQFVATHLRPLPPTRELLPCSCMPPVVAMTATAPADPGARSDLLEWCGMSSSATVFRAPTTVRRNIRRLVLAVQECGQRDALCEAAASVIQAAGQEWCAADRGKPAQSFRAIVFVPSVTDVQSTARWMRDTPAAEQGLVPPSGISGQVLIVAYTGQMADADKGAAMAQWGKELPLGSLTVCVATTAFGTGIHRDDVRAVVSLPDACSSNIHHLQQSGRAGRDGRPAVSVSLVRDRNPTGRRVALWRTAGQPDGCGDFSAYLSDTTTCRQVQLHTTVDGPADAHLAECGQFARAEGTVCDNCNARTGEHRGVAASFSKSQSAPPTPLPTASLSPSRSPVRMNTLTTTATFEAARALASRRTALIDKVEAFESQIRECFDPESFCGACASTGASSEHALGPMKDVPCRHSLCMLCYAPGHTRRQCRHKEVLTQGKTCFACGLGRFPAGLRHVFGGECTLRSAAALARGLFWNVGPTELVKQVAGLGRDDVRDFATYARWLRKESGTGAQWDVGLARLTQACFDGKLYARSTGGAQ